MKRHFLTSIVSILMVLSVTASVPGAGIDESKLTPEELRIKRLADEDERRAKEADRLHEMRMAMKRKGNICISGPGPACGLLELLFQGFKVDIQEKDWERVYSEPKIGNDNILEEFISGRAKAAVICGELTPEDRNKIEKAVPGSKDKLQSREFIKAVLAIVTQKNNSISSLSVSQLEAIFGKDKSDRWGSYGGSAGVMARKGTKYPLLSSHLLSKLVLNGRGVMLRPPLPTGTMQEEERIRMIREYVKKHKGGPFPRFKKDSEVLDEVAKDPNAIGYCLLCPSAELPLNVKLAPISNKNDKAFKPTPSDVLKDNYPLQVTYHIIVRPDASQKIRDFVDYACSEKAAPTISKYGFFPVSMRKEVLAKERLEQMRSGKGEHVYVFGSKELSEAARHLALEFVKRKDVIQFHYHSQSTLLNPTVAKKVLQVRGTAQGNAPLLFLSSEMKGVENEPALQDLKKRTIAATGTAVIANASNTIESVHVDQLHAVLYGKMHKWSELTGPENEISLYSMNTVKDQATKQYHQEHLKAIKRPGIKYCDTPESLIGQIATDKNGIGIINIASLPKGNKAAKCGVKVIAIDNVLPTRENLLSGKYSLAKPMIIYMSSKASETAKDFVNFIQTEGPQEVFEKHGLITKYSTVDLPGHVEARSAEPVETPAKKKHKAVKKAEPAKSSEKKKNDGTFDKSNDFLTK